MQKMFEQQVLLFHCLLATQYDQNLIYLPNRVPNAVAVNLNVQRSSMILISLLEI